MYIKSILFFLTWPALITISYWLIIWALKIYESTPEKEEKEEPEIFIAD